MLDVSTNKGANTCLLSSVGKDSLAQVKCDEVHPTCSRCKERPAVCEWPKAADQTERKLPHPRKLSSCDVCRQRKVSHNRSLVGESILIGQLRCSGPLDGKSGPCGPCSTSKTPCEWRGKTSRLLTLQSLAGTSSAHSDETREGHCTSAPFNGSDGQTAKPLTPECNQPNSSDSSSDSFLQYCSAGPSLLQPSELGNIKQLITLYFKTVHRWFFDTLDWP